MNQFNMHIPICFATDKKYCFAAAVSIISVLESADKNTFYDIFVLVDKDVEETDREKILSITENYKRCSIKIIDAGNIYDDKKIRHRYVSKASLYKFLIQDLVPQYDKILYLDTDVIVNDDLSALYNTDLRTNYIGAVFSIYHYLNRKKYPKNSVYNRVSFYFNAGVLLMNLKLMREHNLRKYLEIFIGKFDDSVDQHIWNTVCHDKVCLLPPKYNVTATCLPVYREYGTTDIFYTKYDIEEALQSPVIYHYTGASKPWTHRNLPFSLRWYLYFKKSPYKNLRLSFQDLDLCKPKRSFIKFIKAHAALLLNTFYKTKKFQGRSYIDGLLEKNEKLRILISIVRPESDDNFFILKERLRCTLKLIFSIRLYKNTYQVCILGKIYTRSSALALPRECKRYSLEELMILPVSEPKREIPSKKVIYTVNIEDYDAFRLHSFVNDDWDYIYFTDNIDFIRAEKIGNWKIYPVKYHQDNNALTNRFYKIHPHRVLPEIYEESIYCDANADICSNFIFEQIKKLNKNILLQIHHDRECIYKEMDAVIDIGMENFVKVIRLKQYLLKQKFPKNYGLTENNIIYRHHNDEKIKEIMEEWYYLLKTYSARDQLSLMYVFWKNGLKPQDYIISNLRLNEEDFGLYSHLKFH